MSWVKVLEYIRNHEWWLRKQCKQNNPSGRKKNPLKSVKTLKTSLWQLQNEWNGFGTRCWQVIWLKLQFYILWFFHPKLHSTTCNRLFQTSLKKFIKNNICYNSETAVLLISKMKTFWYNLQMKNHTVKLIWQYFSEVFIFFSLGFTKTQNFREFLNPLNYNYAS